MAKKPAFGGSFPKPSFVPTNAVLDIIDGDRGLDAPKPHAPLGSVEALSKPSPTPPLESSQSKAFIAQTMRFDAVLLDRLKDAAYHMRIPLTKLVNEAIEAKLSSLEHDLGTFPRRPHAAKRLPPGRPIN